MTWIKSLRLRLPFMPRGGEPPDAARQWHPAHLETIRCLMSVIDAGSPSTRGYSFRVARLCRQLADELRIDPDARIDLEYASLLHDIGRTAIHRDVLLRAGPLTEGERAMVRSHPQVGYDLIKELPLMERVAGIVLAHHEQPDGRGYPQGLTGEQVPMESRIIMVASAFDALAVDRPYRRGLGVDAALEEIRRHSGTQFFQDVVAALVRLQEMGRLRMDDEEGDVPGIGRRPDITRLVGQLMGKSGMSPGGRPDRGIEPSPALLEAMDPRAEAPAGKRVA